MIDKTGYFISAEEIENVFGFLQHKDIIRVEVVEKVDGRELPFLRRIIDFKAIFEFDGTPPLQFVIRGEMRRGAGDEGERTD